MRLSHVRSFASAVVAVLVTAVGVAVSASPAVASPVYKAVYSSSWAYVDSSRATQSFVDQAGDAPVGAWLDEQNGYHTSRSYFTFDVSPFVGRRIFMARLVVRETRAVRCDDRSVDVWRTAPFTAATTWQTKPAELALLGSLPVREGAACPLSYMEVDLVEAIRQAAASGQSQLTIALKVPGGQEHAPEFGRHVANQPAITVSYNTTPHVPIELQTEGKPCAGETPGTYVGQGQPVLAARLTDPDERGELTARFAVWPLDAPHERTELSQSGPHGFVAAVTVPSALVVNERTYAWQVRADDGDDVSTWSQTCYFTYDTVTPTTVPTVSSDRYREGTGTFENGVGVPGTFTFSAGGDTDIERFAYGFNGYAVHKVEADQPGGSAQVTYTPDHWGEHTLVVEGIDRVGHRGPVRTYRFLVADRRPGVTGPEAVAPGVATAFTFRPALRVTPVAYEYQVDSGAPLAIDALPDGTAVATVVVADKGAHVLHARSRDAAGEWSGVRDFPFTVTDRPVVSSETFPDWAVIGEPGDFVFAPGRDGVTAYVYQFDSGPPVTLPAGMDGRAMVTWTPTTWFHRLTVYSRHADGTVSDVTTMDIPVSG